MVSQRQERRAARAPSAVAHADHSVAEVLRLVEHLVLQGRAPDVIERAVAAWLAAHRHTTRGAEVTQILRRVAVRGHGARGPRGLVERVASLQRERFRDEGVAPRPVPQRVRDAAWFAGLRNRVDASQLALLAIGFEPARATSSAPIEVHHNVSWAPGHGAMLDHTHTSIPATIRPGVYVLQLASSDTLTAGAEPDVARVLKRLGVGRPLDAATQARLGPRLAALGRAVELADVVVHDDAAADALCRDLRAEAFCLGRHVAFRSGRFRPESRDGEALLAHELTHVWQQTRADFHAEGIVRDPALEADAHAVAERIHDVAPRADAAAPAHAPHHAPRDVALQGSRMADAPVVRGQRSDAVVAEARALIAARHLHPSALFIVADRITAYDRNLRAVGTWPITGPVPLTSGVYLDGGAGIEAWSTLTRARITELTGGHADDLWVVGAQHVGARGVATPRAPAAASAETAPSYRLGRWSLGFTSSRFQGAEANPTTFQVQAPRMGMSFEVIPSAPLPADHQVGLIQTIHGSTRTGVYVDMDGHEVARSSLSIGEMMDQDTYTGRPQAPWYDTHTTPMRAAAVTVSGADNPFLSFPKFAGGDASAGLPMLARVEGAESFTSWGVVRKPDGTLDRLVHRDWSITWTGRVQQGWRFQGGQAQPGAGGAGPGPRAPITSGPIPNDSARPSWTPASADPSRPAPPQAHGQGREPVAAQTPRQPAPATQLASPEVVQRLRERFADGIAITMCIPTGYLTAEEAQPQSPTDGDAYGWNSAFHAWGDRHADAFQAQWAATRDRLRAGRNATLPDTIPSDDARARRRIVDLLWRDESSRGVLRQRMFDDPAARLSVGAHIKSNNDEFIRRADQFASDNGTVSLVAGQVTFDRRVTYDSPSDFIQQVTAIRDGVAAALAGQADAEQIARVRFIGIYCHGTRAWMGGHGRAAGRRSPARASPRSSRASILR